MASAIVVALLLQRIGLMNGKMCVTKVEGGGALVPNRETNYGPTFGVGTQLELNRNLALRAEWQSYPGVGGSTLPRTDINVIGLGGLWRFQ